MNGTDHDEEGLYGLGVYVSGVKIVFAAYALFLFLRVAEPAARALTAAQRTGPYREDATGAVLAVLVVAVLVALFVGLFLAVFLFVSLHNVGVALTSTVTTREVGYLTRTGIRETSRSVPIVPELFVPPELAWLGYLLPPALLALAGFAQREVEGDVTTAVATVVAGYGLVALVTIVPVAWLFNEVVGAFVADLASSPVADATLRVELRNPLAAHLVVGLVYPAVFGAIGAGLADLLAEPEEGESPGTDPLEPGPRGAASRSSADSTDGGSGAGTTDRDRDRGFQ